MNNEIYNQIVDEAYENYQLKQPKSFPAEPGSNLSKEEFISKCKTDSEFSTKCGLKIEERELDMMERWQIAGLTPNMTEFDYCNKLCNDHNVPTKFLTVTYNNEIIDVYE
jgi:Fe-S cluster biosynthesis and repair protein YggX